MKKALARLGFVLATILWTLLLYGAIAVSLESEVGTPVVILIVVMLALAVTIASRLILGKVY